MGVGDDDYFVGVEFKHGEITGEILAAAFAVHSALGNGFPEVVYQRAMNVEFSERELPAVSEASLSVYYHGVEVGRRRVDFLVAGIICVELKAVAHLEAGHFTQARNYLEAFNLEIGLLINFGAISLEYRRLSNPKFKAQN